MLGEGGGADAVAAGGGGGRRGRVALEGGDAVLELDDLILGLAAAAALVVGLGAELAELGGLPLDGRGLLVQLVALGVRPRSAAP